MLECLGDVRAELLFRSREFVFGFGELAVRVIIDLVDDVSPGEDISCSLVGVLAKLCID